MVYLRPGSRQHVINEETPNFYIADYVALSAQTTNFLELSVLRLPGLYACGGRGCTIELKPLIDMNTQVKSLVTGRIFKNRKEAKLVMGHSNYNRALSQGEMVFITTPSPIDIIY